MNKDQALEIFKKEAINWIKRSNNSQIGLVVDSIFTIIFVPIITMLLGELLLPELLSYYLMLPFKVTPDLFTISVTLNITTLVGLIFSITPANMAARKDLVDFIVEELIQRTQASNRNHVTNYFSKCMISFGRCIELLEKVLNRKIIVVSYEEWLERAEYDKNENQIKVLLPLFRENVFYEPEENSVVTESSPDCFIQDDIYINKVIADEVVECYLKNILDQMKIY